MKFESKIIQENEFILKRLQNQRSHYEDTTIPNINRKRLLKNISRFPSSLKKRNLGKVRKISQWDLKQNSLVTRDNSINNYHQKGFNDFNSYQLIESDAFKHKTFHFMENNDSKKEEKQQKLNQ